MTKNERQYPKGYWMDLGPLFENIGIGIAISIAARRITDGQTVTVDGSAGTVSLS